jgi:hypothetical protein
VIATVVLIAGVGKGAGGSVYNGGSEVRVGVFCVGAALSVMSKRRETCLVHYWARLDMGICSATSLVFACHKSRQGGPYTMLSSITPGSHLVLPEHSQQDIKSCPGLQVSISYGHLVVLRDTPIRRSGVERPQAIVTGEGSLLQVILEA